MAEIIRITSEALQATVRRLLPSQQGFGDDLLASSVITPIIDLTPTAEGSSVPDYQAQAISFGNVTEFNVTNTTTALANSAGFWRFRGTFVEYTRDSGATTASFTISNGLSQKTIYRANQPALINNVYALNYDFTVFLRSGDSVSCTSGTIDTIVNGIYYQVADVNGDVNLPTGFTPQ